MVPYKSYCFAARSAQGLIQGRAKIGHRGAPLLTNFFGMDGYCDKSNACKPFRSMLEEVLLVIVKVTRSLILVPFQRASLVKFA